MRTTLDRLGVGLIWDEWASITRFLESSRMTYFLAQAQCERLLQVDHSAAEVEFESQGTLYRVSLEQHLAALRNMRPLHSAALIHYFALAEAAVADHLGRDDTVGCNGIENWAEQLLAAAGTSWRDDDERLGIVEVGVVRNLIAHGESRYSKRAVTKLTAAGMSPAPTEGDRLVLDYETLKLYRSRLKGLLNRGGLGASGLPSASS